MSNPKKSPIQGSLDKASWLTRTLPIRLFGDPVLSTPCDPVTPAEIESGQVKVWADQLTSFLEKYREYTGYGRGLAANQLGISKQMVLTWPDDGPQIYINPQISSTEGEAIYPEACISAASLVAGDVKRPYKAKISYTSLEGKKKIIEPDGLLARLLLHEIDHLSGHICTDEYVPGTIRILNGNPDEVLKPALKRIN